MDFRCVHLFQFFSVCDQYVSFPDSSRVQSVAKEQTWQDFRTTLMQSRQVFGRNRVMLYHRSKWNYWSFVWFSESPLAKCLPISQEILSVSQIAFRGTRPPFFIQTWLKQYCKGPATLSTICFRSVRCWRAMIPGKVFTGFGKFKGSVSSSYPFPEKFLFCTVKIGSTELPCLAPRQCIDDCFEIHICHQELCDLQLSSHQVFPLNATCTFTCCWCRMQCASYCFLRYWCRRCRCSRSWGACR